MLKKNDNHDGLKTVKLDLIADLPISALIDQVNAMCDQVEDDPAVAVLVMALAWRGANAAQASAEPFGVHLVNRWERTVRRLEKLNCATVAVATAPCNDLGFALLLATDIRLANSDFRASLLSESGTILPGMSLYRLVRQVGWSKARGIILFGAEITADDARAIGIVDKLINSNEERDAYIAALNLVDMPGLAVRRRLMSDALSMNVEDALGIHLAAADRMLRRAGDQALRSVE